MARKGVFRALQNAEPIDHTEQPDETDKSAVKLRRSNPNTKLAAESIREEDRRSTRLISPTSIKMSALQDRLDPNEDLDDLVLSIKEDGQQVPILVRKLDDGSFEIVYGRRRLLACQHLGIDVRASILELTDEEALVALGVENSARQDTSFIERALFVNQISELGYNGVVIRKATGISETQVYKMRAIAQAIPRDLITKIGAAHGAGRRQWEALAKLCKTAGKNQLSAVQGSLTADHSVDRLSQAITAFTPARAPSPAPAKQGLADGAITAKKTGKKLTLSVLKEKDAAFVDHLLEQVPEIYEKWRRTRG